MNEKPLNRNTKIWVYPVITVIGVIGILGVLGFIGMTAWPRIVKMYIRVHQQNVILELKQWEKEYSNITTREEALRSAEMIKYVNNYYFVGTGYRSDPQTEQDLEYQRKSTLNTIQNSLRQYTKQDVGDDLNKWKEIIQKMPEP